MGSNYDNLDAVNDVIRLSTRHKGSYSQLVKFRKIADDKDTECNYRRMLHIILDKASEHFERELGNCSLQNKTLGVEQVQKSRTQNTRKLKGKSVVEEDSEDTRAVFVRKNNSSEKGVHCIRGARARPSIKDKVQVQGEFAKAESSRKKQKHCEIRNAKVKSTNESDDDIAILEDDELLKNLGSFTPSKMFHNSMEEDSGPLHLGRSSGSKSAIGGFRKKVLDVLGQPFDKHELKRLREAARDGSYYYYHPDLGSKLKRCRYKKWKCLNILRGFFFWLQNLRQEGAFKPWKDGQCLAMEPTSPVSSPPPSSSAHPDRAKEKLSKDSKHKILK